MQFNLRKRKLNRSFCGLLFMILLPTFLVAQQRVTGVVTDKANEPLAGVSVSVKGASQTGTSTDGEGRYSLSVPANAVLSFSFIGFKTKEEPVNRRSTVNVVLLEDEALLEEVVVVGYGTRKKVTLTGAVSDIK
jgi:hypothetical protein